MPRGLSLHQPLARLGAPLHNLVHLPREDAAQQPEEVLQNVSASSEETRHSALFLHRESASNAAASLPHLLARTPPLVDSDGFPGIGQIVYTTGNHTY